MKSTNLFNRALTVLVLCACFAMAGCGGDKASIPVSFLTLSETEIELEAGEIHALECVVSPYNADNQRIIWSTSDKSVATVKDGVVTAVKAGNAIVTAMADDNGKTATCAVTVIGEGGNNNGSEDTGEGEKGSVGPLTWSLDKVTEVSATFTGSLDVPESDLSFSQVTVYYSDAETFNTNDAKKSSATTFDADKKFTITVTGLKPNVKYKYCLIAEVKSEKTYGDVTEFTTLSLVAPTLNAVSEIGAFSVTISGKVTLPSETVSGLGYGFQYCTSQDFGWESVTENVTKLDSDNKFSVEITSLTENTTYYYRSYIEMSGASVYGGVNSFKTQSHPYNAQTDLNISSASDLSSSGSANCYIVSKGGLYKFKAVKGNSSTSVGSVSSAAILWETFGTDTAPEYNDLISAFCYKDGYIAFKTSDTFKEGNAVLAAKDANGTILWSWHIWLTDQPLEQAYYNSAGTMMDRNLGATSATPGDVGALGLLYQWGRKDPFLGSSHISRGQNAKSTITWPSSVSSNSSNGKIEYATAHPTTFITYNSSSNDWYYTGSGSVDNTRWTDSRSKKSIYDPCPAGWRVPDGGENGIWSIALGSSSSYDRTYNSANEGINFSGELGSATTIWYPAPGYRRSGGGSLSNVGNFGGYWSASPGSNNAYRLCFYDNGYVSPSYYDIRAYGYSVRCSRE